MCLTFPILGQKSKYGKEANLKYMTDIDPLLGADNKDLMRQEKPFRTQKVNMIWQKSKKHVSEANIQPLFADLLIQDREQLKAKKIMADGNGEDGEVQAATRQKLMDIMKKYGIYEIMEGGPHGVSSENEVIKENIAKQDGHKMDSVVEKKVDRLWKMAKQGGFSDSELADLKKELDHHEKRMEEFRLVRDELDIVMKRHENAIDTMPKHERTEMKRKLDKQAKEKYNNMMDRFLDLEGKISQKIHNDGEFQEDRVVQLWNYAKRANFSDEELSSLKQELYHYEVKIKKHKHFQDELDNLDFSDGKHDRNDLPLSAQKLGGKLVEGKQKLKKYDRKLTETIAKQLGVHHSEL